MKIGDLIKELKKYDKDNDVYFLYSLADYDDHCVSDDCIITEIKGEIQIDVS